GAAAGGMFLFTRDHVAGAHRSVLVPPAFAHADTAFHRVGKTSLILGILEIRLPLRRIVLFAVTQIFVAAVRANDLARVHFPVRVPDLLEFTESLHQLLA